MFSSESISISAVQLSRPHTSEVKHNTMIFTLLTYLHTCTVFSPLFPYSVKCCKCNLQSLRPQPTSAFSCIHVLPVIDVFVAVSTIEHEVRWTLWAYTKQFTVCDCSICTKIVHSSASSYVEGSECLSKQISEYPSFPRRTQRAVTSECSHVMTRQSWSHEP